MSETTSIDPNERADKEQIATIEKANRELGGIDLMFYELLRAARFQRWKHEGEPDYVPDSWGVAKFKSLVEEKGTGEHKHIHVPGEMAQGKIFLPIQAWDELFQEYVGE